MFRRISERKILFSWRGKKNSIFMFAFLFDLYWVRRKEKRKFRIFRTHVLQLYAQSGCVVCFVSLFYENFHFHFPLSFHAKIYVFSLLGFDLKKWFLKFSGWTSRRNWRLRRSNYIEIGEVFFRFCVNGFGYRTYCWQVWLTEISRNLSSARYTRLE